MLGWGVNAHGQLGLGPSLISSFVPTPQRIDFFNERTCIQVACSLTHSLFLLADGNVYSAGNNEYLQLGREGRTTIPGKTKHRKTRFFLIERIFQNALLCHYTTKEFKLLVDNISLFV